MLCACVDRLLFAEPGLFIAHGALGRMVLAHSMLAKQHCLDKTGQRSAPPCRQPVARMVRSPGGIFVGVDRSQPQLQKATNHKNIIFIHAEKHKENVALFVGKQSL